MQPGDIFKTHSSTEKLFNYVKYKSKTGIKRCREFYKMVLRLL